MSIKTKSEIRSAAKAGVRALSATQKAAASASIFECVMRIEQGREASTVALFSSLPDEPQTASVIAKLDRKSVV